MIGFQRLSHTISTSCRSQSRHTTALLNFSASSVDRTQPPQHQPINFATKWFSSTTTGRTPETKTTKDESAPLVPQQKNFSSHAADGPVDYGYMKDDSARFTNDKPTIAYAKSMPHDFCGMRHEQILQLSVEGDFGARREALIRNVMAVDSIEYADADVVVTKMWEFNQRSMYIHHLPYQIGFGTAVTGGLISFPLIFGDSTARWFNENYVTTEVPPPEDMETYLECAMWTWNWMEPICGQVSFVLLVAGFARSQMVNMGIKPFGNRMKAIRSRELIKEYSQYNTLFVKWFSEGDTLYNF